VGGIPPIEQLKGASEGGKYHLGSVTIGTRLVGPFAGLQFSLDIDLAAFSKVLLGYFCKGRVEDDHPMPLGLLYALTGALISPRLISCHR